MICAPHPRRTNGTRTWRLIARFIATPGNASKLPSSPSPLNLFSLKPLDFNCSGIVLPNQLVSLCAMPFLVYAFHRDSKSGTPAEVPGPAA